jgi:hypothetical protein
MGCVGLIGVVIAAIMLLTGWPYEAVVLELLATIAISQRESS